MRQAGDSISTNELLSRLRSAARVEQHPEHPRFGSIPRKGNIPLSFSQERLWLLDHLEPDGAAYNVPIAFTIRGPLDTEALRRSLTEIWRRHEALRTTFEAVDERPVQRVRPAEPVSLQLVDLRGVPPEHRETRARSVVRYMASCAFSLSKGPLFRQLLVRLGAEEHILLIVIHHIVFDAWSQAIFLRELCLLYNAFHLGSPLPLKDPVHQFQDYARWQRAHLSDSALAECLEYWRDALDGLPPALDLLPDRARPVAQSPRGAELHFAVQPGTLNALGVLCREQGATLFMALLAGLQVLLYRWTGQKDVAVGAPAANRSLVETEQIIGYFINVLVLRTKLRADMSFIEALQAARETTLGALAHQDVPFEKVVETIRPHRTLSHSPLFQVMLSLQNAPHVDLELDGLEVRPYPLPSELTKFELNIHMLKTGSGIDGIAYYSADLFERATIERLIAAYLTLLERASARPGTTLRDLGLWGDEESKRIAARRSLRPGNPFVPFAAEDIESSIAGRFELMADRYAGRVAVSSPSCSWTYEELDRKANLVARRILERGGQAHGRVALLFGHDASMVAAMLGALKAGRAYVPLDPTYPARRLRAMLEHSNAELVIADHGLEALAGELASERGLFLFDPAGPGTDERPGLEVASAAHAYVLYTSGSTGRPKAVMQNNRNVLHFIRAYTNNLHISADDRLTVFSTYCFDAAVMDIYGALLNGASLHLYDLRARGFAELPAWLTVNGITVYHSTPTVFRHSLEGLAAREMLPSVRLVVLGGEPAYARDLELYKEHFTSGCLLVNGLGPTESTVTLQFFADRDTVLAGNDLPVGRPVEGCEVELIDEQGRPDLQGEIVIRGRHVALGYLNEPGLTAAAFRPARSDGSVRTYSTGDLGRQLPDGNIVFVGRKDSQVKIRGYRVEPGESEILIRRYPGVSEAVVIPRARASGEKLLAAYFVTAAGAEVRIEDLRTHLRDHLPEHMVPAVIRRVDALPLAPNGKLDVSSLPLVDDPRTAVSGGFVPPRTEIERIIADCWATVLGVERVGVHDNFFELGGSSLSATRIIGRLRAALRIDDLPMKAMFLDATVAGLARCLTFDAVTRRYRYGPPKTQWSCLLPMQPRGMRPPLFIVAGAYAEEQSVRYLSNLIPHLGTDQPVYGLEQPRRSGEPAARKRVEDMARELIREMRAFQPEGPYLLGGECIGGVVAYEMAQQLTAAGQRVDLLVLLDTLLPSRTNAMRFRANLFLRRVGRLIDLTRDALHAGTSRAAGSPREESGLRLEAARRARLLIPRNAEEKEAARIDAENRAYSKILYKYKPRRYPGELTLLVNERDGSIAGDLGWGKYAAVDLRVVPGNHITRLTLFARDVAAKLRECLDRACAARKDENP